MKKIKYSVLTFLSLIFLIYLSLYLTAMNTGLPGRKGGPQDAFRHTLASALVARYISPKAVEFVTFISERNPNSAFDLMDIHNNYLGIQIGLSKAPIYDAVKEKVSQGSDIETSPDQILWLPKEKWSHGL